MKGLLSRTLLTLAAATSLAMGAEDMLTITDAWARATPPGATTGAVYMTIANAGSEEIAIMQIATPRARTAEIHRSIMQDGMMRMAAIAGLVIPPGEEITLEPGGLHIMLMGLGAPLAVGEKFPVTIAILGGPQVTEEVEVRTAGANHDH